MKRVLAALFLLALALRLFYLAELSDAPYFHTLVLDAEEYEYLSQSLLQGQWQSASERTYVHGPLYPLFWALLKLGGADYMAVRLVQALVGALSCVLLYAIAGRLFPGPVPLLSGLLAAAYWPFILYSGELLATTLVLFIELLLLAQLLCRADPPKALPTAGAGVLLGLLAATRSNTLLLALPILAWLYYRSGRRPSVPGTFCLGLGAALAPFLVYNYLVQGTPLPFQGAWSFYMGTNPAADGTPYAQQGLDWQRLEVLPYREGEGATPASRGRFYLRQGLHYIAQHPLDYLDLLYRKFRLFWHALEVPVSTDIRYFEQHSFLARVLVFDFSAVAPLALVGMLWSGRRWRQCALLYGFALAYLVSGLLFTVCDRYRLPAVPFLMVFAAEALRQGWLLLRARAWRPAMGFALALILAATLVHTGVDAAQVDRLRSAWLQGQVHMRNKEYALAEEAYGQALKDAPGDADIHNSLGTAHALQGHTLQAEAAYRRALVQAPDFSRAWLNLAQLLRGEGRLQEAHSAYREALDKDPRPGIQHEGNYYLSYLYMARQDYALAYEACAQALRAEKRAAGYYALANICHHLGRQDEQIHHLRQAVSLDPDFAGAHRNLGALYLQRGEYTAAEEALQRALRLEPGVAIAHYNLGMLYLRTGRQDLARQALAEAARLGGEQGAP